MTQRHPPARQKSRLAIIAASAEQLASQGLRSSAIVVLEHWATAAPDDLFSRVRLIELLQAERRTDEASGRARKVLEVVVDPRLREHLADLLGSPSAARR